MNFDRVIDIVSIFYRTKNQVRGLCVGGGMAILFFDNFKWIRENRPHPFCRNFENER